jgi:hypothetical protein
MDGYCVDVLGRTRATLTEPASTSPWPKGLGNLVKLCRAGDRALQLLLFNEECLVSASHQLALITSLPFCVRGAEREMSFKSPVGETKTSPAMPSVCKENPPGVYLQLSMNFVRVWSTDYAKAGLFPSTDVGQSYSRSHLVKR